MMKLPMAQPQTRTAMDEVTSSAGTRTRRATPIQKRAKTIAAPRANMMVDRENVRKIRRGRKERRSCDTTKDCFVSDGKWAARGNVQRE
jgi:hypothetical protein